MTIVAKTASSTWVVPAGVTSLRLIYIGGGGAGGTSQGGNGGGGAGEVKNDAAVTVTPGETLTITIGAGGAHGTSGNVDGGAGGNTTVAGSFGTKTALGGGGGGGYNGSSDRTGGSGACGGGAPCGSSAGIAGSATATGGTAGGASSAGNSLAQQRYGGGGGGWGAAGNAPAGNHAGDGGAGVDLSAYVGTGYGVSGYHAAGGGGGHQQLQAATTAGAGGNGGGGRGGADVGTGGAGTTTQSPTAGQANTGSGGGGGGDRALGSLGADGGSGVVYIIYSDPVPGDPTSVASPSQTTTTLDLSWSAPSSGGPVTSYDVRIDGGAASTATSPHTFTGLSAGTSHTLEVRAVGPGGTSAWVGVTVSTLDLPPGVPTSLAASSVGYTVATLSWSAPSSGGPVTSYDVRHDGGAASTATSPHTFTGLSAGTSHTLEVRAVGPGGTSAWVSVSVDTLATPEGYYRVELTLGDLSWTVESGTDPDYGPRLPITLGWRMPDTVEFYPCQAEQTSLTFQVYVAAASDLVSVVKGSTVTFAMYVDADPGADPWQTFAGIVTQLDGAPVLPAGGFLATVYALDDTARLDGMVVGWTSDWPLESIGDRLQRICDEAGITYDTLFLGTGLEGWLSARGKSPVTVLQALRDALKDAADRYDSEPPDVFYGRHVISYDPAATTMTLLVIRRRIFDGIAVELDGCLVNADGSWSKLPGPDGGTWVVVDDASYGTPDSSPPVWRGTSLVDYFGDPPGSEANGSATTRANLARSFLPDGSTELSGWYARSIRYQAYKSPAAVGPYTPGAEGLASFAPPTLVIPVVVTDVAPRYDLADTGYLAGSLTGAQLVIPPGGRYYVDLRLRPELLPGTVVP